MEIELPNKNTKRWSGCYAGNYYGDVLRTFNVDFERNPGYVSIANGFTAGGDTTDTNLRHLSVIDNFTRSNADGIDRWWGLNRKGYLIKTDSSAPLSLATNSWDEDNLDSTPTDAVDMTVHENDSDSANGENKLFVTRDGDIAVLNDTATNVWTKSWWVTTKSQTALKSSKPHPIEYFPFRRITLVGDGNLVHTIDKDGAISYARIILPLNLEVWGIFTTPSRAWILCGGLQGNNGAIVEWDGYSQTYNYIHDGQSSHVVSGVNYFGMPIVVNSRGLIMEYNGSSFYPMVRNGQKICFPSYEEPENGFLFPSFSSGNIYMSPRGMAVTEDGIIHINIQGPFFASNKHLAGTWCLNPETGMFYLKYSYTLSDSGIFGYQAFIGTAGGIGAIKATGVDVGAGGGILSSVYLLGGGRVYSNYTSTVTPYIWRLLRTNANLMRGYFITQFFTAEEIQEQWDTIWLETTPFKNTDDVIIIKAKGVDFLIDDDKLPLQKTITWTSTTTFTVTINGLSNALRVGDEIEVLAGRNAGVLAHIITISGNHGFIQTITIDETVNANSGSSLCRFDRWKKLGIINNNLKYNIPLNIGITSSFIQFKIEMRGYPKDYFIKKLVVKTVKQTKNKK